MSDASGLRLDRATGLFDLLAGGSTDLVQLDGEGLLDLAIAKEFDLVAAAVEQAGLAEAIPR